MEGVARGRVENARANVELLCRALGIELDAERRAELEALDEAALAARLEDVAKFRDWR